MLFPLSVAQICDMTMCCIFCIFHAYLQFSCCCIVSMTPYRDMLYKHITECAFDCIWVYVFKWILQLKKNHQRQFNKFIQSSSTFLCRMTIRNYNPQPCKLSRFYTLHVHCRLLVWRFFWDFIITVCMGDGKWERSSIPSIITAERKDSVLN